MGYVQRIEARILLDSKGLVALEPPYDKCKLISVAGRPVYALFGSIDYYPNKEELLSLKYHKSKINKDKYETFLSEMLHRFNGLEKTTDLLISIETTSLLINDMAAKLKIPYIEAGFKKLNKEIKMRNIKMSERGSLPTTLKLDQKLLGKGRHVCLLDDFLSSGTTFKHAFSTLPENVTAYGVCLFKLNS